MPLLRLETTVPKSKIPEDFHLKLSEILSDLLQKSKRELCISVMSDLNMKFGGVLEPCAWITLLRMNATHTELNQVISKAVCGFVVKELELSKDKVYIMFVNMEGQAVGTVNGTF